MPDSEIRPAYFTVHYFFWLMTALVWTPPKLEIPTEVQQSHHKILLWLYLRDIFRLLELQTVQFSHQRCIKFHSGGWQKATDINSPCHAQSCVSEKSQVLKHFCIFWQVLNKSLRDSIDNVAFVTRPWYHIALQRIAVIRALPDCCRNGQSQRHVLAENISVR